MSFASDVKTVYHIVRGGGRGRTHAECLENSYRDQAASYDKFRERLLQGRRSLYQQLPMPRNGIWLDMGGGTGANLKALGNRLKDMKQVYLVDLCPSLLQVARQRIAHHGWTNVTVVEADVTTFSPPEEEIHGITFSYSLTMIPNWAQAITHAQRLLSREGHIGVVDFTISSTEASLGLPRHSWWSRQFWPRWFAHDRVFLNPEHPQTLAQRFETIHLAGYHTRVPYLPGARVPYYQFIGKKNS